MLRSRLLLAALLLTSAFAQGMYIGWITQPSSCGDPVGYIKAIVNGGTAPYTYSWNTGASTDSIGALVGGDGYWYVLTVTDATFSTYVDSAQLDNTPELMVTGITSYIAQNNGGYGMHPCPGQSNGALIVDENLINGQPPYSLSFDMGIGQTGYDQAGHPIFGGFADGDLTTLYVTDSYGCGGQAAQPIVGPVGLPPTVIAVDSACAGVNGSFTLATPADPNGFTVVISVHNAQNELLSAWDQGYGVTDTTTISGLPPGDYSVIERWNAVDDPACSLITTVTIPAGVACGNVNGTLYMDHDQNCVQDAQDPGIPFRIIDINPGGLLAITDANGRYTRNVPYGSYALGPNDPMLYPLCPSVVPVDFSVSGLAPQTTIDLADSSLLALDLGTEHWHTSVRIGFDIAFWNRVQNLSGQISGPITAVYDFDPTFSYVNAFPTPTSVVGNTVTWSLPALSAFQISDLRVTLHLPPDPGLLGQVVSNTFTLDQPFTETSLANNTSTTSATITGSFDPNEKTVEPRDQYLIGTDSTLTYTIRFQNTGTDTAFTVVVVDSLPVEVDMGSLEIIGASHTFTPEIMYGRVLRFTFNDILLPDSNTNEPASHGVVSFRVRPVSELPGTLISNAADIYFDFNPPVHTADAVVVMESTTYAPTRSTGAVRVFPNPATDLLHVQSTQGPVTHLRIMAADGRLVRQWRYNAEQIAVPIADLHPGQYLLVCSTKEGDLSRTRFVKY